MSRSPSIDARLELPVTELPGFAPLVNGGLWSEWANRGHVFAATNPAAQIRYLRLKSATSCRLLFDSGGEALAGVPEIWQIRLFADSDRARGHFEKIGERKPWLAADPRHPFIDEAMAAVGTPFPVDHELRTLRHCFRSYRLRVALEEALGRTVRRSRLKSSVLSYKPGRRAVLRVDTGRADERRIVRVVKPQAVEALARHLRTIDELCRAAGIDCGPGISGVCRSLSFVLCTYRAGEPIVRGVPARAESIDALTRCAGRLAALHRIEPPPSSPVRASRRRRAAGELVPPLIGLLPGAADRIRRLADAVDARSCSGHGLVHGDLHLGQILQDGSVIDWDQAGRGDPLDDLGSLIAHMHVARAPDSYRRSFLEAYQSAYGSRVDVGELDRATARALFFRLGEPFRKLDRDWPRRTRVLLALAEQLVEGRR